MISEDCTVVFFDVRNFTNITQYTSDKDKFFLFIKKLYEIGLKYSNALNQNGKIYINSTGDGFLCIFFGDKHYMSAYLMGLAMLKTINPIFDDFYSSLNLDKLEEGQFYYGIGIESGNVVKVEGEIGTSRIETYIGNVINIASRLESLCKEHARTGLVFGPEFNFHIIKEILNIDYIDLNTRAKNANNRHNAKAIHYEMGKLNEEILSMYMFEHKIKGSKHPISSFRISKTLLETTDFKEWIHREKFPEGLYTKFLQILNKEI